MKSKSRRYEVLLPVRFKWMKAYKARWKRRLEQLEIWMVSYTIDIE